MDCKTCKEIRKQAEATISRYAFEATLVSFEKTIKRLWIVIIILILLLAGSNAAWIYYESQFADESWTYEATADNGSNAIANGDGEVYFYGGSRESDASETDAEDGR